MIQRCINNLLDNAIKYGDKVNIELSNNNSNLFIKIEDNGIGRKSSGANKKSSVHKSMAMKITRDRIESSNKKYKTDGSMVVTDYNIIDETGTKVLISLPYIADA